MTDDLEDLMDVPHKRFLIVSCDDQGILTIEESDFASWETIGIATFLHMTADSEMDQEIEEGNGSS